MLVDLSGAWFSTTFWHWSRAFLPVGSIEAFH